HVIAPDAEATARYFPSGLKDTEVTPPSCLMESPIWLVTAPSCRMQGCLQLPSHVRKWTAPSRVPNTKALPSGERVKTEAGLARAVVIRSGFRVSNHT